MGGIATIAALGATALGGVMQVQAVRAQGDYQKALAYKRAEQIREQGKQRNAQAQRKAIEIERRKKKYLSDNIAAAAASGLGASDISVLDLQSQIVQEGEYRKLSALYEGKYSEAAAEVSAQDEVYSGMAAKRGSIVRAASTALGTAGSLALSYDAYGKTKTKPRQKVYTSDGYFPWQKTGNRYWEY